ncbi:hypothetical protein pb186bvf_011881 [Paramecium bursaria]
MSFPSSKKTKHSNIFNQTLIDLDSEIQNLIKFFPLQIRIINFLKIIK